MFFTFSRKYTWIHFFTALLLGHMQELCRRTLLANSAGPITVLFSCAIATEFPLAQSILCNLLPVPGTDILVLQSSFLPLLNPNSWMRVRGGVPNSTWLIRLLTPAERWRTGPILTPIQQAREPLLCHGTCTRSNSGRREWDLPLRWVESSSSMHLWMVSYMFSQQFSWIKNNLFYEMWKSYLRMSLHVVCVAVWLQVGMIVKTSTQLQSTRVRMVGWASVCVVVQSMALASLLAKWRTIALQVYIYTYIHTCIVLEIIFIIIIIMI